MGLSRNVHWTVTAVVAVLGIAFSGCNGEGSPQGEKQEHTADVARVIDGDTIELADVGSVRLIGIDTPERGECGFVEATEFTEERIGDRRVRYVVGEEERDPYGRLLAYVYDPEGRMHNLELAEAGYAEALTIPPNYRYADRLEAAAREAHPPYDC